MKKLLLLLVLCFALSPIEAHSVAQIRQQLQANLAAQVMSQPTAPAQRNEQIKNALATEVFRRPQQKDWDYFLTQNQLIQQTEQTDVDNSLRLMYYQYDTDCHLFRKNLGRHLWGKFRPNYAKEARRVKYIYVADASDHDTKTIPEEITHLVQQVRTANPTARILLALEFAERTEKEQLPIRFAHDSEPLPFQITGEDYMRLITVSDQHNIDILGLDDSFVEQKRVKIGDMMIKTPLSDPRIQQILAQYDPENLQNFQQLEQQIQRYTDALIYCLASPEDAANQLKIPQEQLAEAVGLYQEALDEYTSLYEKAQIYWQYILHDFLSRSDWGVLQRNRQWASYIKAVSPFYDIVITYAGNGHMGEKGDSRNVPDLIAQPYVLFNFYTDEQIPQERQEFYEQVEQIQEEEHSFTSALTDLEVREDVADEASQWLEFWNDAGQRKPPQGQESEKYYFEQMDFSHLTPEEKRELAAQCNQFSVPPSHALKVFDVYIISSDETPQ